MRLYNLIKPILFSLEPELAHDLVCKSLEKFPNLFDYKSNNQLHKKTLGGLEFPNPIGLAAGFDKNAKLINQIQNLGFGFMEVGTITPKPQSGNPKPRMVRLELQQSLINSMGFNNDGLDVIAKRLEKRTTNDFIIGANIGKNKSTPNYKAHQDYSDCFYVLQDLVDYITINISSPNTPTLRELLENNSLQIILETIQNINKKRTIEKPVFLKISPDLTDDEIIRITKTCESFELTGIVSTNTTTNHTYSYGGLSGKLLSMRSRKVSNLIKQNSKLIVICSGGIVDKEIALDRLNNFDLIQLYTGLVYQGPTLPRDILKSISQTR